MDRSDSSQQQHGMSPGTRLLLYVVGILAAGGIWIYHLMQQEGTWAKIVYLFWSFIILPILIAAWKIISEAQGKRRMDDALSSISDFEATYKVMSEDGGTGIAIDVNAKKISLLYQMLGQTEYKVIPYSDIIEVAVVKDGVTITETKRGSQLAGAVVGGLTFGVAGAVVGGLSGKKVSKEEVNNIELRLILSDLETPTHSVNFGYDIHEADQWYARMKAVISQN